MAKASAGEEKATRIRDEASLMTATVAIPFERMGRKAVECLDKLINQGAKRQELVQGPYLLMDAVLVDKHNVPEEGKWPW